MTKGERIKRRREELTLTQTQLAEAIGSTKQNLYKYENDIISNIPSDKVEALAHALKTTPAYLMGWEEKDPPTQADERIWERLCENNIKLTVANWVADLELDDLVKVASILGTILDKEIPPTEQD